MTGDFVAGRSASAVIGGQGSRFLLLGRVEAWCPGGRAELGRRRERGLLGVLSLEVNRVVSADRLMDLLWDGSPPDSARPSLYAHVSRLRAALDVSGCGESLDARDGGYVLEADPQAVDAHRFTALVARARGLDDPGDRVAVVREALALWRGPVLEDAGSDLLRQRVAADLAELRLVAWELALDADLDRGRHGDVIGEVSRLVGDYPLREGLWARLALALYRAGRQGDALAALAQARERIVETLGVEPGPDVREMQRRILAGDPGLAPVVGDSGVASVGVGSGLTVPRQLPMDIAEFVGRRKELSRLETAAVEAGRAGSPTVCVIEGMAGVGKTRLAVHVAHRVSGGFDGPQLWTDLYGFDARRPPADPSAVLEMFLRLLGVPAQQVPDDLDGRAALYRSRLAGTRALVLLDNVAGEDQVRPLLPGGGGTLVLITTRRHLSGLSGARHLPLDVFDADEAVSLLAEVAGAARVEGQVEQAARVAGLCGYLPIAIALAGRRLRAHPSWTLSDLAERLVPDQGRLGELSADGQAVQTAFDLSYRTLPPGLRRFFRLLGPYPGADISADGAAALTGYPRVEADRLLEALYDEHLLREHSPGRYRMHSLARDFALQRAHQEEPRQTREEAAARPVRRLLPVATRATLLPHPPESRRVAPFDASPANTRQIGLPRSTGLVETGPTAALLRQPTPTAPETIRVNP